MSRILVIAEVSQKQAYIFGARDLATNLRRSGEIEYVTGESFFKHCWNAYENNKNLVYTGGGHTVLQFESLEDAENFCKAVTYTMIKEFPNMEMFIHQMKYDESLSHGENLTKLSEGLETKKSFRSSSFRQLSFGVEHSAQKVKSSFEYTAPKKYSGWNLTTNFGELAGATGENFIAVVHLDGNSMGTRVQNIYKNVNDLSWDKCVDTLQKFSNSIDRNFKHAYNQMLDELIEALDKQADDLEAAGKDNPWKDKILPVRKVIGAGDDVCFVTSGQFGIECAVSFLKHLSKQNNEVDKKGYAACAGIVMIHTKYPFRVAYDLSEELCSSAKKYGAGIKSDGSLSVIDWHIEFGQMKGSLSQIREDYWTEDNGRLELRPLVVVGEAPCKERSYAFFHDLTAQLIDNANENSIARSKIKQLRKVFRQGEQETLLAIRWTETENILTTSEKAGASHKTAFFDDILDDEPIRRCLYFDSIEVMDHIDLWRKEDTK